MENKICNQVIIAFIAILVFRGLTIDTVSGERNVNFTINITDPPNDVEGMNPTGQIKDDADILELSSSLDGTNLFFKLRVAGTIHNQSINISYLYSIYIDINMDGNYDWIISASTVSYTSFALLQDDFGNYTYNLENVTGIGTDTLTIKIPLDYITDDILGWDIYGMCSHLGSIDGITTSVQDTAPDFGFTTNPEGDKDEDGMPNGWEGDNGLNPNNASDASEDPDGDNYTNLEEYKAGTDPMDPEDWPSVLNTSISVIIEKPINGEVIKSNSYYSEEYKAQGTASPVPGTNLSYVEWYIADSNGCNNWYFAADISSKGDWSEWEAELSIYSTYGSLPLKYGENTLVVRAIDEQNNYNKAMVTFIFEESDEGDGSDGVATPDPSTETPTDLSIEISIDYVKYDITELPNNKTNISAKINGTTNGVDHCEICFVNYYSDGTHDEEVYWMEEFDAASESYMDDFDVYHFKATSKNWKTWEYKMKGTVDSSDSESPDAEDNKTVTKSIIYVRAYKDAGETNWNQDSYTFHMDSSGGGGGGDSDSSTSAIPGFEMIAVLAALGAALLIFGRKQ